MVKMGQIKMKCIMNCNLNKYKIKFNEKLYNEYYLYL